MDCTEQDLIAVAYVLSSNLCQPRFPRCAFGKVVNVLIIRGKNQGFVQFEDPTMAMALLNYYAGVQASIKGKHIFFQASNRDAISSQQTPVRTALTHCPTSFGFVQENPNHILLATIQNVLYPVTIEIIHAVFSKYGAVKRIIIFSKNSCKQPSASSFPLRSSTSATQH